MAEFIAIKSILFNIANTFFPDLIEFITSYLILLMKKIEFQEKILDMFIYQNKLCLTIANHKYLIQVDSTQGTEDNLNYNQDLHSIWHSNLDL